MRLPDPRRPLAWDVGGEPVVTNGASKGDPLDLAAGAERHAWHMAEATRHAASGFRDGHDYHARWARDIANAIEAGRPWRRASGCLRRTAQ